MHHFAVEVAGKIRKAAQDRLTDGGYSTARHHPRPSALSDAAKYYPAMSKKQILLPSGSRTYAP